ncbi:hypothetical protein [Roseibium aquae]|nr:hypothetical protein [Roseibium aquae]
MPSDTPLKSRRSDAIHDMLAAWGREIGEARALYGLSEAAFASCLFVPPETILRLERGDPAVSLGLFVNALWALGLHEQLEGDYVSLMEIFPQAEEGADAFGARPEGVDLDLGQDPGSGVKALQQAVARALEQENAAGQARPFPVSNAKAGRVRNLGDLLAGARSVGAVLVRAPVEGASWLRGRLDTAFRRFRREYRVRHRALRRMRAHRLKWLKACGVDFRYRAAWVVDMIRRGGRRSVHRQGPPSQTPRVPTRRELRRQIVSQAVARARRLNSGNTNIPAPGRRRA